METINNQKLAKAIDFINEWSINYYNHTVEEKPDPYAIQDELYKKLGIDYVYFEYAYRIMKYEGLIDYVSNDDNDTLIRAFSHTEKGLLLFLNGGMHAKVLNIINKEKIVQDQLNSTVTTNSFIRKTTRFQIGILTVTIIVTAIGSISTWGQYQLQKQNTNKPDTIIIENRVYDANSYLRQLDSIYHKRQSR